MSDPNEPRKSRAPDLAPLRTWLKENGISPALFYTMPEEDRPPTIKVGNKRMVVCRRLPDWEARMFAKTGGAA